MERQRHGVVGKVKEQITREGLAALREACSPRQWRIVLCWLVNLTRPEIAQQLGVSRSTVDNQIARLKGKRLSPGARSVAVLL